MSLTALLLDFQKPLPFINSNTGANACKEAPTFSPHSLEGTFVKSNLAMFVPNFSAAAIIPSDIVSIALFISSAETFAPKKPVSISAAYTGENALIAVPTPSAHSLLGPFLNATFTPAKYVAASTIPLDTVLIALAKSSGPTPPPSKLIILFAANIAYTGEKAPNASAIPSAQALVGPPV